MPQDKIRTEIAEGTLKILRMRGGRRRTSPLYLIFADRDAAGPGVLRLAEIIREGTERRCGEANETTKENFRLTW